jgi:peroxiredoxin
MIKHCLNILVFSLLSLNLVQAQSYHIAVEIPDLPKQYLKLAYHSGPDVFLVDSALTNENGLAIFQGENKLSHGVYFVVMPSSAHFVFIVGNQQHFKMRTYQFHVLDSLIAIGDIQNSAFFNFQREMAEINQRSRQLAIEKTYFSQFPDTVARIESMENEFVEKRTAVYDSLSNVYAGSEFGALIKAMIPVEIPDSIKAIRSKNPYRYFQYAGRHHFDHIDFEETILFNSPAYIFHNLLEQYCVYFLNSRHDSVESAFVEVDLLLNKASVNEVAHRYVLSFLMDYYEHPPMSGMDAVYVYLANSQFKTGNLSWVNAEIRQKILNKAALMEKNLVGKTAPNLIFPDKNENLHSLHETKGRYTILWFYEPDCGICESKTRELFSLRQDLKTFNIDLITINIDDNRNDWLQFIDAYNSDALHLYNLNNHPDLYLAYGLNKTPRLFIIDADKTIVAKDIRVESVLDYIEYLDENSQRLKNRFLFQSPVQE